MFCVLATCLSDRGDQRWIDIVQCMAWCSLKHDWKARASRIDPECPPQYVVAAAVVKVEHIMIAALIAVSFENRLKGSTSSSRQRRTKASISEILDLDG